MIRTVTGLYRALDNLLEGISPICERCQESCAYDDCRGYVWLLKEEAARLVSRGAEVVEVNRNVRFINSFAVADGSLDFEQFKPSCPLCVQKRCSVHSSRPLVCRMYPLGFLGKSGTMYLVLYMDCLFSQEKKDDPIFREKSLALFKNIDLRLLRRLLHEYIKVLNLSMFPRGNNRVVILKALGQREGGDEPCPSARLSSTARR